VLYRLIFRVVFARFDPEQVHHFVALGLKIAGALKLTKIGKQSKKRVTTVRAIGFDFPGPFGLAAGFDKNAELIQPLADLGFSHIEVGTVTARPQSGNDKPRLFRLLQDRALINRMGFNNDGADAVARRLAKLRSNTERKLPIIGVNIGKSKVTPVENAAEDYRYSAKVLAPYADYLAVNVSSPNTPGLRALQAVDALKPILKAVLEQSLGKPVLVKIAPDLTNEDIIAVAALAKSMGLAGVIATNTTISRAELKTAKAKVDSMGAGGLSGAPLKARSLEVLKLLANALDKNQVSISVGGVETRQEVEQRMKAGASLVQGYTGFVYHGPFWARKLNKS